MTDVFIMAGGIARSATAQPRADLADFRKATQPMLWLFDAIDRAVQRLPSVAQATVSDWGLVVGVDHGELEVTKEFLCTLQSRGMARPFLFQNSLHNATLGFLSMQLRLTGPGATTSTGFFCGEDALDLASDYVRSGATDVCIAGGVEVIDADMLPAVQALLGERAIAGSGAAAVILASGAFIERHSLRPWARLDAVHTQRQKSAQADLNSAPLGEFYGAQALEQLVACFDADSLETHNSSAASSTLRVRKPDGGSSRIDFARMSEARR